MPLTVRKIAGLPLVMHVALDTTRMFVWQGLLRRRDCKQDETMHVGLEVMQGVSGT